MKKSKGYVKVIIIVISAILVFSFIIGLSLVNKGGSNGNKPIVVEDSTSYSIDSSDSSSDFSLDEVTSIDISPNGIGF